MKIIKNTDNLSENIDYLEGRLITINNEYLYLMHTSLKNKLKNVNYLTIDSGFILIFLNLFSNKKYRLITGFDLVLAIKDVSNRKIIIIGKELENEIDFLNKNKLFSKINAIYGSSEEIYEDILLRYDVTYFNNSVILIMLGAEKQELLAELFCQNLKLKNCLIAGLGGTWEQIISGKKVPYFFIKYKLSWLFRTIKFWDKSKPKKLFYSLLSFCFYRKLLTLIKN